MITITCDGEVLYAPNLAADGCTVLNPTLTQALNKAGSLKFLLPPGNHMYKKIKKLKSIIKVFDEDEEMFRGRVLDDEKDFYNRKQVYCEGDRSFLIDSPTRPYSIQADIIDVFEMFLDNHNASVEPEKQFKLGRVTVTDSNNYINRSNSNYSNTLDQMEDKLIKTHGGYIKTRLSNGIRYLDYLEQPGEYSSQVIEFGKNLLDITEYINAEDVFTVLIPIGAEQKDSNGNTTGKLTIKVANEGIDYIESEIGIKLFGRIWRVEEWEDVTLPMNLLSKGKAFLADGIKMAVSLKVKAVDLHHIDVNTEKIRYGDYVRVVSAPHEIDEYFMCTEVEYNLADPSKTEFTFGISFRALTEKQISEQKSTHSEVSSIQSSVEAAREQSTSQATNIIAEVAGTYVSTETYEAGYQSLLDRIVKLEGEENSETE